MPLHLIRVLFLLACLFASGARTDALAEDGEKNPPKPSAVEASKDDPKKTNETDKKADGDPAPTRTVAEIAAAVRKSVVVVTHTGRDGRQAGLGTGFVVGENGLIATNLHVIGQARAIGVQTADGKRYQVTEVVASDRLLDLALIRVDAKGLIPLPLGDSEKLEQGAPIVAVGNPRGLKHSVVSGVVSGRRTIDGKPMIQIAIPIEPGNSGGPLLDMQGRVQGILTLKSLVTANLGFAVEINALKPLIAKPNPIPMRRWLTIGALDPKEWTPYLGSRWRQRAGRIHVQGFGTGFGGRSFCLSRREAPKPPYELAVSVRLDDETGAAGLVFSADGDKHYGFYPTGGRLRLTRFNGPDLTTWTILANENSEHYRPGEWNHLKVRVEEKRFLCYVNDCLMFESADGVLTGVKVGLTKFRNTNAEFKGFVLADKIPPIKPPDEVVERINGILDKDSLQGATGKLIENLLPDAAHAPGVLRTRAAALEKQVALLRRLARDVHNQHVIGRLAKLLDKDEGKIDLLHASLLIAKLDNDEVDVPGYRAEFDRLVGELAERAGKNDDEAAKIARLNKYLFAEGGFHGSRSDYYNKSNSYLNEVLDDREGLPITLSVLYMELARRMGLNVVGVGLPGHFVVKHIAAGGEENLIDVYEGGEPMTREQAAEKVKAITGGELKDEHLQATSKKQIVIRMISNLMGLARRDRDAEGVLRYLDAILALTPSAGQERWVRAVLRFQDGRLDAAMADTLWLLEHHPEDVSVEGLHQLQRAIEDARK